MKRRLSEFSAAAIGVAVVVGLHLNDARTPAEKYSPIASPPDPVRVTRPADIQRERPQDAFSTRTEVPAPEEAPAFASLSDSISDAEQAWDAARNELAAVEAELAYLDQDLSDLADRFAVRETAGEDPDALDVDRSHQYDELVNRYEALQQQAAALEEAEYRAAEQLEALLEARSD